MNGLNKTESAIYIYLIWFGWSRGFTFTIILFFYVDTFPLAATFQIKKIRKQIYFVHVYMANVLKCSKLFLIEEKHTEKETKKENKQMAKSFCFQDLILLYFCKGNTNVKY